MDFYEQLKDLCANEGISVSKLEKDLGFSNGSLSKGIPNAQRLLKIADYFDLPMEYFVGDEDWEKRYLHYFDTYSKTADAFKDVIVNAYDWVNAEQKSESDADKGFFMDKMKFDIMVELSKEPKLFAIVERASKDNHFKERLLKIVDLMEMEK